MIDQIGIQPSLWQNLILNEFMRSDIMINPNTDELQKVLKKLSKELNDLINSKRFYQIK